LTRISKKERNWVMKLAVSARGQTLDSELDPRFGRAKYFLLVDPERGSLEVVENKQNLQLAQGAGIQAAQTVVESGAQAVLTGNCGPKAFKVLEAAKIPVAVGLSGTVREALRQYKENKLSFAQGPNVEGHW
jgi:predicted Fe-Mo cluster-binding NifX family protein